MDIECGNGTCIDGNCQCDEGYVNDENICVEICESINCCDEGFKNVGDICVDISCEGVDCGTGADCLGGNCVCQTGYASVENVCEETCSLNPCKELIDSIFIGTLLQDLCKLFFFKGCNGPIFTFVRYHLLLNLSNQKNGGICSDNEGTAKFSCICTQQFVGERCEDDPCEFYPCLNNGTCFVDLINGKKAPKCECPQYTDGQYTGGQNCNLLFCGFAKVPCYNDGICTNSFMAYAEDDFEFYIEYNELGELHRCQCSQENGIAKYHGESCEMPGRDACAGSPCQNDGSCTTFIQGETQVRFIKNIKIFLKVTSS